MLKNDIDKVVAWLEQQGQSAELNAAKRIKNHLESHSQAANAQSTAIAQICAEIREAITCERVCGGNAIANRIKSCERKLLAL
jgi:hypothetical protein